MGKGQLNKRIRPLVGIAALLILLWTAGLAIGVTMGRYISEGSASAAFTSKVPKAYVTVAEWTDDHATDARVSNYTPEGAVADEDITLRVRVYVKDAMADTEAGLFDPNGLVVKIKSSSDGTTYTAEYTATLVRTVDGATYLGKTSGAGWMYAFSDKDGNELTYILEKDKRSDMYFTITVGDDSSPIDTQDVELKIETVRAEKDAHARSKERR